MGFNVLQNKYLADYQKFGLKQNPDPQQLLDRLLQHRPSDAKKAKAVFEYISLPELQTSPNSTNQGPFKSLFTYIDFGPSARPFLLACGVKNEPTVQEIAQMLIADPAKFYALAGSAEEYLQVLRNIAANVHLLGHGLKKAMQRSAFILGSRRVASSSSSSGVATKAPTFEDEDDEIEAGQPFVHVLALPGDVVIIDDSHSYSQFTTIIIACPQEEVFEQLAESLGAPRLTQLVKESFRIQRSVPEQTERSEEIRRLLIERTALFLHERQTGARDDVIRDAEWLKRHLTVKSVEQVSLQRQLVYLGKPHSSVLESTAAASMEGRNSMVLYLVRKGEIDWFELASSICKLILAHQKLSDSLFFVNDHPTNQFEESQKARGECRSSEMLCYSERREAKLQRQLDDANRANSGATGEPAKGLEERFRMLIQVYSEGALCREGRIIESGSRRNSAHGCLRATASRLQPPLPASPKCLRISQRQSGSFSALASENIPSSIHPFPLNRSLKNPQIKSNLPIKPPVQITPMSDIPKQLTQSNQRVQTRHERRHSDASGYQTGERSPRPATATPKWWMSAFIEQYFLKVSKYIISNQSANNNLQGGNSSTTQSGSLI
ncbi:hypothetical protein PGT21_005731 [Puccinia graminis f. sp. tritici]|uniref:Uncharacterized protein n=1 Tax=Puccinia graminis f. sp. tritici TaxID=56615 RepID=A0A5B0MJY9_PUCGR|nr:hypothetical protein PGT21_005731 [Puccinia graminis f. sp. tritici]